MNKFFYSFLLMLFPTLVFADASSMSFAPPSSDYSVGYLAEIFGIVDGVLHGTGSQIVGSMFEVFNAAVMALGGIIIAYTMIVSTMNTAHEGEMLGKKWNSIWVPVRATAGLALLIPKSSGYCLLQIFVMWVVVQGVGAADKLWNAALSYLNRGGVIIQQEANPIEGLTGSTPAQQIVQGAMDILSGAVCMLTVQKTLEQKLSAYTNAQGGAGSYQCSAPGLSPSMQSFCNSGAVPNFIESIDAVKTQRNGSSGSTVSMTMPNFDPNVYPLYSQFNGICGTITWNSMSAPAASGGQSMDSVLSGMGLTEGEYKTASESRAIAIQQMFSDLAMVAQVIVGNDPYYSSTNQALANPVQSVGAGAPPTVDLMKQATQIQEKQDSAMPPYEKWATQPFGVPLELGGDGCPNSQGSTPSGQASNCISWGVIGNRSPLLNGTELQSAVLDYNGVMAPTLSLIAQANSQSARDASTQFIAGAESKGWILAGSYFFDLVLLNNTNRTAATNIATDPNSGLGSSSFNLSTLSGSFATASAPCPTAQANVAYPIFCELTNNDTTVLGPIFALFTGQSPDVASIGSQVPQPQPPNPLPTQVLTTSPIPSVGATGPGPAGSTVYGYLQNSVVIQLPGSPPTPKLMFANVMHIHFADTSFRMPPASFSCMGFSLGFVEICIGRWIGEIIENILINTIIAFFTSIIMTLVYSFLMTCVSIPLQAFASIFTVGIKILEVPGINPIVALANMGTYYINFVGKLWFIMLVGNIVNMVLSIVGIALLPLMAMALPVVIAWSILMLGIGMTTAYYIPLVPYMIFTFGAIAWFMAVIEAMVAAPIVALGIIHPEGHDAFGKGEAAIMILMNVFLRPAMMIIGFIIGISLSYVGVWLLNAGFDHAVGFMQQSAGSSSTGGASGFVFGNGNLSAGHSLHQSSGQTAAYSATAGVAGAAGMIAGGPVGAVVGAAVAPAVVNAFEANYTKSPVPGTGAVSGGYVQWAGVFAYFFSILIYTMMYMTIVEKAFMLISVLPDKVLRWIGGQPESHGQDAAQWMGDTKGKVEKSGEKSGDAMAQTGKGIMGSASPPESGGAEASEGKPPVAG